MEANDKHTPNLWSSDDCHTWLDALNSYETVIASQGSEKLGTLDKWYRSTFPALLAERKEPFIQLEELQGVAAWKMTRGVWRERNRHLIGQNTPETVEQVSRQAFAAMPDRTQTDHFTADHNKPIAMLSKLSGVGPATASAVMAAYAPEIYPFFDELVAEQIPDLGPVAFTARYYVAYADALLQRAARLTETCTGGGQKGMWTAQDVAQALWAASGGKNKDSK